MLAIWEALESARRRLRAQGAFRGGQGDAETVLVGGGGGRWTATKTLEIRHGSIPLLYVPVGTVADFVHDDAFAIVHDDVNCCTAQVIGRTLANKHHRCHRHAHRLRHQNRIASLSAGGRVDPSWFRIDVEMNSKPSRNSNGFRHAFEVSAEVFRIDVEMVCDMIFGGGCFQKWP